MIQRMDKHDSKAVALMGRVHRGAEQLSLEQPLCFGEVSSARVVALGEGEEVHSACSVLVRDFITDGITLRGGLVGSVSTDPRHRGQGLATRLMVEAEITLEQEHCVFALLWAEDPHFYLQRGYCPIGGEEDLVLPTSLVARLPVPTGVRPALATDYAAIHGLYLGHRDRLDRSLEETAALLDCPRMDVLVREEAGDIVGYTCRGRGRDMAEAIHEWGGAVEHVLPLLRANLERRFDGEETGAIVLVANRSSRELLQSLESMGIERHSGILGLGKILDHQAARDLLAERLGSRATVELLWSTEGPRFHLTGPEKEGYLDDDAALALLFPSEGLLDDVDTFLASFGLSESGLPLSPFVWGLDSI